MFQEIDNPQAYASYCEAYTASAKQRMTQTVPALEIRRRVAIDDPRRTKSQVSKADG